jgi:hypothetical protein
MVLLHLINQRSNLLSPVTTFKHYNFHRVVLPSNQLVLNSVITCNNFTAFNFPFYIVLTLNQTAFTSAITCNIRTRINFVISIGLLYLSASIRRLAS